MGFFSSNKGDQPDPSVQPDFVASVAAPDPQTPQPNIDGVIPPAGGVATATPKPTTSDFSGATTAPPVDDIGTDYIMTDPPAATEQPISPAYSSSVGAPSVPVTDDAPAEPETTPDVPDELPSPPETTGQEEPAVTEPEEIPEPADELSTIEPAYPPEMNDPTAIPVSVANGNYDESQPQDLDAIKQQALSQLSPLVSHLNQTPEERFNTTMMMLQATDDQSLVPTAYEAAQAITDEKTRAQALLDIVNEINYFTNSKRF